MRIMALDIYIVYTYIWNVVVFLPRVNSIENTKLLPSWLIYFKLILISQKIPN